MEVYALVSSMNLFCCFLFSVGLDGNSREHVWCPHTTQGGGQGSGRAPLPKGEDALAPVSPDFTTVLIIPSVPHSPGRRPSSKHRQDTWNDFFFLISLPQI